MAVYDDDNVYAELRMLSVDVIIVTVRNYISTIRPIFETRYGSYVF